MLTENSNYKYVHFLDYILTYLKSGHKSGISYFQIRDNYTTKTGIIFYEPELVEFFKLYEGVYFKEIDGSGHKLILTDKSKDILKRYNSISDYLTGKNQFSFLSRIARKIRITKYPKITLTKKQIIDSLIFIIVTIVSYAIMIYIFKWF